MKLKDFQWINMKGTVSGHYGKKGNSTSATDMADWHFAYFQEDAK
jgi:hypothetical protein